MAEVIDICRWLRRKGPTNAGRERTMFRIRLCGPDLRWVGLVGSSLARALSLESFETTFEDTAVAPGFSPILGLRAGRPWAPDFDPSPPGLVVDGTGNSFAALVGCTGRTVLLSHHRGAPPFSLGRLTFPGIEITLPIADPAPEPLAVAAACIGGAARLLGTIRWPLLLQALQEELTLAAGLQPQLYYAAAFEAFQRLVPQAGLVAKSE